MKTVSSHDLKIKEFFKRAFNREPSDGELESVSKSLYYLGRAIDRYERKNHERNDN